MDDQFGGRTDDDLFFDDFEPVESDAKPIDDAPPADDGIAALEQVANGHSQPAPPPLPADPTVSSGPADASTKTSKQAPRSLMNSRHNPERTENPKRPPRQHTSSKAPSNGKDASATPSSSAAAAASSTTSSSPAPAAPAAKESKDAATKDVVTKDAATKDAATKDAAAKDAATKDAATKEGKEAKPAAAGAASVHSESRIGSGANPRTKLSDAELAAKMEKMRILAAEKTRKFEQAEQDERDHAVAYARGMEEARKRRLADAERKRQGEEDRRRMEEERAKNRERKLKAMGMKEGGWDEGKELLQEEEGRRSFRGAHGGIRGGARTMGAGLSGSRYANDDDHEDTAERSGDNRGRGRGGRGRGAGRGRGRGGAFGERTASERDAEATSNGAGSVPGTSATKSETKPDLAVENFPALPSSGPKVKDTATSAPPPPKVEIPKKMSELLASPLSPPVGNWGDEMEAVDAKLAAAGKKPQ